MASPNDPAPSIEIVDGEIVELDGRRIAEWDALDHFIARHGIDVDIAAETMALSNQELAHRLVSVDVPRSELVRLSHGATPAKLAEVVAIASTLSR